MRRRTFAQRQEPRIAQDSSPGLAINIEELVTLIKVFEHAHSQISKLSEADGKTIEDASGTHLIPSLYARAGLAASRGFGEIPLLAREVGLLEAAVVNLESYEGNEVVLVSGYELLAVLASREKEARCLCQVHGILSFADGQPDPGNEPAIPSLPGR
jgi:hypothetical protein